MALAVVAKRERKRAAIFMVLGPSMSNDKLSQTKRDFVYSYGTGGECRSSPHQKNLSFCT